MVSTASTILMGENKDGEQEMELFITSLPKESSGKWQESLYKYEGFWFDKPLLQGVLIAQKTFQAQSHNIILATLPKSGTTWFAALLFTLTNRTRYDFSDHPLLTSYPHECAPGIEFYASNNPSNPIIPSTFSLLSTHIPYSLLPESIKSSNFCPIVYVCRDPSDVFVSLWHHTNKLRPKELPPLVLEEAFDLFCQGLSPFGSYWDHVLEYWKASLENPIKVLFVTFEDMKSDPVTHMKRLANFVGCPFSPEEETGGVIDKIVNFCSIKSLASSKVNQETKVVTRAGFPGIYVPDNYYHPNNYFRKGEVGDHKNHLSDEMIKKIKEITEMKFRGSGLELYLA